MAKQLSGQQLPQRWYGVHSESRLVFRSSEAISCCLGMSRGVTALTFVYGLIVVAALFYKAMGLRVTVDVANGSSLTASLSVAVDDLLKAASHC